MPIDPLLSTFVAMIVLRGAWRIIQSSGHILLEAVPAGTSIADINPDLAQNATQCRNPHPIHLLTITAVSHLLTVTFVHRHCTTPPAICAPLSTDLSDRYSTNSVT